MTQQAPPAEDKVVIVRTKNTLAAKLGLAPNQHLTIPQETITRMNAALAERAKEMGGTFADDVRALRDISRARGADWVETLYARAHDVRGLAATFDKELLGRFASGLCLYIESLEDRGSAKANIVASYVEAMVSALMPSTYTADTAEALIAELRTIALAHAGAATKACKG